MSVWLIQHGTGLLVRNDRTWTKEHVFLKPRHAGFAHASKQRYVPGVSVIISQLVSLAWLLLFGVHLTPR